MQTTGNKSPDRCARKKGRGSLERLRKEAVQQVLAGASPRAVAQRFGFGHSFIYGWLAKYRQGGWEALKSRRITGRRHRLTEEQRAWVCEALARKTPLECMLSSVLWTHRLVGDLIQREFQIRLSPVSVGRLLRKAGFAWCKPWSRAPGHEAGLMDHWRRTDYRAIRSLAWQTRAEIVFLDISATEDGEPGGDVFANDQPTTDVLFRRRFICGVSPRGRIRFMMGSGRNGESCLGEFIRRLMQETARPVFLIIPGGMTEAESLVQACVASFDGRLRLFVRPTALTPDAALDGQQPAGESRRAGGARSSASAAPKQPGLLPGALQRVMPSPPLPAPQPVTARIGGTSR